MFRLAVLTLISLSALCVLGGRIIGGTDSNIDEIPYIVSQHIKYNEKFSFICAGTIITPKVILTAAHCYFNDTKYTYYIRYGSSYKEKDGTLEKVSNFIIHDNYSENALKDDIALYVLENPIKFTTRVAAIGLPHFQEKIKDDTMTIVSGWGKIHESFPVFPKILQKAFVPIVNFEKCNTIYENIITPGMLCAGYDLGGIDACQGDSGGPLVANKTIYGVVSWGSSCAQPFYSGVYTDVAYYRKWIDSNLEKYNAV